MEDSSPVPSPTSPGRAPFKSFMAPYTPGCVFEHFGRIPEEAYSPIDVQSPLEEAVYSNNVQLFKQLVQGGEEVSVRLKIGQMSCLEYAAMKGFTDLLNALLTHSMCSEDLQKYFKMEDVVERAYMISKNKTTFFGKASALAEANRYLAALYTAVVYDQPGCVRLMLDHLGKIDLARSSFFIVGEGSDKKLLNAGDLASSLGHKECSSIIAQWQQLRDVSVS